MNPPVRNDPRGDRNATGAPLRVLFIATDLSSGGGVNKVIRDLAVLFHERLDTEVAVANARSDAPPTYAFPPGIAVQSYARRGLLSYFGLLLQLRRSGPDVVVSSWAQDNILTVLAFLSSRTKVVPVEHAPWHFHRAPVRLLRRMVYPLASELVVLNRTDLEHFRRYLKNVRLIPDPVEAPTRPPNVQREKLIIAIGHLEPHKNFEDALRAMARSGLEANGWSLAIIGSGSSEPSLRRLIGELGLTRTHIHPPTQDLASWYARASLMLVTSRLESFSLVLAEAVVDGVVPIAYTSDGPSFILEDFPAHLVPIGDVDALTTRLAGFANTADLEPLRKALSASVEARFSPDKIAEQWKDVLGARSRLPVP